MKYLYFFLLLFLFAEVKSQTFDLNFEQQNLTSDPFAHKDNIVLKNNLLGISIINSE